MLTTDRLELRLPVKDDVARMFAVVADAETGRFLGPPPTPSDHFMRFQRNAGSWLLHGYGGFMVWHRPSGAMIGNCGVFHSYRGLGPDFDDAAEAGWILARDGVGRGLAREAMEAAFAWFDVAHGPQRAVCMIHPDTVPSLPLAAHFGFTAMRDAVLPTGEDVRLLERRR